MCFQFTLNKTNDNIRENDNDGTIRETVKSIIDDLIKQNMFKDQIEQHIKSIVIETIGPILKNLIDKMFSENIQPFFNEKMTELSNEKTLKNVTENLESLEIQVCLIYIKFVICNFNLF